MIEEGKYIKYKEGKSGLSVYISSLFIYFLVRKIALKPREYLIFFVLI